MSCENNVVVIFVISIQENAIEAKHTTSCLTYLSTAFSTGFIALIAAAHATAALAAFVGTGSTAHPLQ